MDIVTISEILTEPSKEKWLRNYLYDDEDYCKEHVVEYRSYPVYGKKINFIEIKEKLRRRSLIPVKYLIIAQLQMWMFDKNEIIIMSVGREKIIKRNQKFIDEILAKYCEIVDYKRSISTPQTEYNFKNDNIIFTPYIKRSEYSNITI